MKTKVIIMISLFLSLFLTGCEKELVEVPGEDPQQTYLGTQKYQLLLNNAFTYTTDDE